MADAWQMRPVPVPDAGSAGFWEAAARRELAVVRCSRCQELVLPPDSACPHCLSADPAWSWVTVSGTGSIRSWTVMRQSFLPGFDVPFVLVDVELAAQADLRMIGRLLDGPESALQLGAPVVVDFEDLGEGVLVPAFRLAG